MVQMLEEARGEAYQEWKAQEWKVATTSSGSQEEVSRLLEVYERNCRACDDCAAASCQEELKKASETYLGRIPIGHAQA